MSRTIGFLIVQCLFLAIAVNGAPESVSEETPDFFSMTAKHVSEMIRKQLMSTFTDEASRRNERAAEEEGSEEEGNPSKPELHYSTLRAQASGSGFPSPTMFVGGFSFMMMPAPEGEKIFNGFLQNLPTLPGSG